MVEALPAEEKASFKKKFLNGGHSTSDLELRWSSITGVPFDCNPSKCDEDDLFVMMYEEALMECDVSDIHKITKELLLEKEA